MLNNVDVPALLWKDLENAEISKDGVVCYRLPRNIVEVCSKRCYLMHLDARVYLSPQELP